MIIQGQIWDQSTMNAIPGATVMLFVPGTGALGTSVMTDQNGDFSLNTLDNLPTGSIIQVSANGYSTQTVDPYIFSETSGIGLKKSNSLVPVVIAAAGVTALGLLTRPHKRKVGSIGEDLLLVAVVGGLGYYALKKILPDAGKGISDNNAQTSSTTTVAASADLAKAQASGQSQTLSDTDIANAAAQINNDLQITTFWTGKPNPNIIDAVLQVAKVNNSVDWYALVKAFGVRNFNTDGNMSTCSWFATGCTQLGLVAALQQGIQWSEAYNTDGIDAKDAVDNLNLIMEGIGVSERFNL